MTRFNLNEQTSTANSSKPSVSAQDLEKFLSKEVVFRVSDSDMYKITQLVYGKRIEILEGANDTTHDYNIKDEALSEYEQKELDEAIRSEALECYSYRLIFRDLVQKKLLEPGRYYLRVSW